MFGCRFAASQRSARRAHGWTRGVLNIPALIRLDHSMRWRFHMCLVRFLSIKFLRAAGGHHIIMPHGRSCRWQQARMLCKATRFFVESWIIAESFTPGDAGALRPPGVRDGQVGIPRAALLLVSAHRTMVHPHALHGKTAQPPLRQNQHRCLRVMCRASIGRPPHTLQLSRRAAG